MINFFNGIIVGIGGIAPGLSGSILLVIFGLYQKTIDAIGNIFKNFKKNVLFLVPLFLGFGVGILLFSKVVDFLLVNYEMYTRFAFLGLIVGTVPLFHREIKKKGFNNKYYILVGMALVAGIILFLFNKNLFPTIKNPNLIQSVILGVAVAGSTIVPGVDSAAILSALGLYEIYVSSIANLNFTVLIPAGCGLALGALIISFLMSRLLKKYYTITFSVIFGLFLAIIPSVVLYDSCKLELNVRSFVSIGMTIVGFLIAYFLGKIEENEELQNKIKILFKKKKKTLEE